MHIGWIARWLSCGRRCPQYHIRRTLFELHHSTPWRHCDHWHRSLLLFCWLQGSSAPRDVRPSVHRCLIYLGDLARYAAQAAPKAMAVAPGGGGGPGSGAAAAKPEWQRAAHFYR